MKIASLLLLFLFAAINISAQETEPLICPVIRITSTVKGPKEKLSDGATAKFTAILEPKKPEDQLKYNWILSSGKIVSGQGTDTVQVERQIHYVTATVHIDGFRTDGMCLQAASETVWWDVEPTAEKMKVLSGEKFERATYDAGFLSNIWPDTTLHIIFGHKKNVSFETVQKRENDVLGWIGNRLDRGRISIEHIYDGAEIIEFWRVPAGAPMPTCTECRIKLSKEFRNSDH